jgi:hypothetical protein
MALLERPSAMRLSTSRSRSVSRLSGSCFRAGDDAGHDRRVEHALAVGDSLQAVDKDCDVGDAFFQQVAATVGVLLEELDRVAWGEVLGKDEHADIRVAGADLSRRYEPFVRLCRRHADVDDRDVRLRPGNLSQQLIGIAGLADDLDPRVCE